MMEGGEADEAGSSRERRVLAKLVARDPAGSRGVFELGDGRRVTVDGHIDLDAADAPRIGEKALVVIDEGGRALRWEPYPGRDLRRRLD